MKLKTVVAFIFVLSLTIISFAQKKDAGSLVGSWESVNVENARGLMMKLNPDKTFILQTVLTADYSYSIKGDRMINKLLNAHTGKMIIDTSIIKINKDTLTSIFRRNGKDETTVMVKMPGKENSGKGILGNYTWKYPNGHTAFSKFTKDGKWLFRLPIETEKGKYSLNKNTISFHYANADTVVDNQKFWFKKNLLILTNEKTNKQNLYRRVDFFLDK